MPGDDFLSDNFHTIGYQQNLKFNEAHQVIAQAFFEERGYTCVKADTDGAKTGGITMKITNLKAPRDYISISVKADSWVGKSGNLFVEMEHKRRGLNNQIIKEQGWLITLKAQKLVIVDTENEYVYLFDWATLKKFINDNLDNPSVCTIQEKENRFDRQCLTKAALIRIDTLIGNGLVEARRKYKIVEV